MNKINKILLVLTIFLGSFTGAKAFDLTFDNGNGLLFYDSSQGFVGHSFDMGGGTTMYHNFDTGFSGSSFDNGLGSTLYLETSPSSLYWVQ